MPRPSATWFGQTPENLGFGQNLQESSYDLERDEATTERVSLGELVATPARYANKTVRVEGQVTAVCQNKGCWLELGHEASSAHVKLQGHRFFVPQSSAGKLAEVEARVLPVVEDGHCEQEAQAQTGKTAKVELEATGVELY